jgi:hypothetical protein
MSVGQVKIASGETPKYLSFGSPPVLSTTTNQNSNAAAKTSPYTTFQAIVTGTGAVTATVAIQVSNEDLTAAGTNSNWCATVLGTITLTGTTAVTDGFTSIAPWRYVRAVVTNVTGTGATVQVLMGN